MSKRYFIEVVEDDIICPYRVIIYDEKSNKLTEYGGYQTLEIAVTIVEQLKKLNVEE